ncbi:MAG: haloacid dehalogenase, partial [Alphaproteobacteria bacterium]|nr:haloacid dehalogenase [Alphaproteobacteria bacterium]
RSSALDPARYPALLRLARDAGLDVEVYTAEGGYFIERMTEVLDRHQKVLGRVASIAPLDRLPGTIVRLQFVVRESSAWQAVRAQVRAMVELEMHEATSPNFSDVIFASVTTRGTSKLSTAGWIAAQFGLEDLARVAMVGDGDNDLELIRAAGLGIAMGNAPEHIRAAADRVVARVEDAGLADALDALG